MQRPFADGNNDFALAVYGQLREKPGNLFLSPFSIRIALGMTQAGARGETAAQMREVLRMPADFTEIIQQLNEAGGGKYEMAVANSLWSQDGDPLLPEFVDVIDREYGGGINLVDFRRNAEAARKAINNWVEDRTKRRILDLIPRDGVDSSTSLVLVNAIYFKGLWELQFKREATRDEAFYLEDGRTVPVPMMHQCEKVRYMKGKGFQAVDLVYEGGDLSMLVLLPDKDDGLQDLEQKLSAQMLDGCVLRLGIHKVDVFLPRFKVTWGAVEIGAQLEALGMPLAFSSRADFSGIDGKGGLFITAVFHKTFVEVNEEGTEAAAATAVAMGRSAPAAVPTFRANHPFLFAIRDHRSGAILFFGRITDPTGETREAENA